MKKIIYIVLLALASCSDNRHEVRYSPDGKDSVVYVQYYDGNQYNSLYMVPEQFETLYDEGGYEQVYDYYLGHQLPEYWVKKYKTYKRH